MDLWAPRGPCQVKAQQLLPSPALPTGGPGQVAWPPSGGWGDSARLTVLSWLASWGGPWGDICRPVGLSGPALLPPAEPHVDDMQGSQAPGLGSLWAAGWLPRLAPLAPAGLQAGSREPPTSGPTSPVGASLP